MPAPGGDTLADVAGALAALAAEARAGGLDDTAALTALAAVRSIAAGLEHSELAVIEAARDSGATWTRIAAAMGARNRQTAQKRHADLARRCPRPPSVDTPAAPGPRAQDAGHDRSIPQAKVLVNVDALPKSIGRPPPGTASMDDPVSDAQDYAGPPSSDARRTAARRRPDVPRITDAIIVDGCYELVRAPDYAETRAWHVLVGGKLTGLVRPTWRGERSRPGWEPVDAAGTALPATGIGRVTSGGNARTRDAAAISLLRTLQRQQGAERKKTTCSTTRPPCGPAGRCPRTSNLFPATTRLRRQLVAGLDLGEGWPGRWLVSWKAGKQLESPRSGRSRRHC